MPRDPSSIPSELRERLRDESAEEQADLEAVWSLLGTTEPAAGEDPDPAGAWATVSEHHPELGPLDQNGTVERQNERPRQQSRRTERSARRPLRQRRRRWGWGVALVVLVLIGGLWLWRQPVTVTASAGEHETVTLPDGSTVELNSGTVLRYRRGFQAVPFVSTDRRVLRLEGEAFFDVASSERPFAVKTVNALVSVTGTRFNVRSRADEERITEVTVTSGQVQVSSSQQLEQAITLESPGQTSRVAGAGAKPTAPAQADVEHVLAWRDDGFAVRDWPLSKVVHELERRFDVPVRIHASVDQSEAPLSLYYPSPTDLETILHDVCTALDLSYRPTRQGFEIVASSTES